MDGMKLVTECHENSSYSWYKSLTVELNPFVEENRITLIEGIFLTFKDFFFVENKKKKIFPNWPQQKLESKLRDYFSNWLIVNISDGNKTDPIVPDLEKLSVENNSSRQLTVDIANAILSSGVSKKDAVDISKTVCTKLFHAIREDVSRYHEIVAHTKRNRPWNNTVPRISKNSCKVTLSFADVRISKINMDANLLERMKLLWVANNPFVDANDPKFGLVVYCLMSRYSALDRRFLRQGSLKEIFMKDLYDNFGVEFEMFSSATNSSSSSYCTLFPDLESFFGGKGSFFEFEPEEGFYQSNPPLVESLMDESFERVSQWLESEKPLSFIILSRPWPENDDEDKYSVRKYMGTTVLRENNQMTLTIDPSPSQHIEYVSQPKGGQITKFSFPKITIAQNEAGRKKWDFSKGSKYHSLLMKMIKCHTV